MENSSYIIGQYYQVPTVRGEIFNTTYDWPVIGPLHTDVELINFRWPHYHIDWRFVPKRLVEMASCRMFVHLSGVVLLVDKERPQGINAEGLPAPVTKRLRCKREFPDYPLDKAEKHWLVKLEDAYQDCTLKTPVCPHRGLPLDKLPCKHDGSVTCPGHGLSWNLGTGQLVRFTQGQRELPLSVPK